MAEHVFVNPHVALELTARDRGELEIKLDVGAFGLLANGIGVALATCVRAAISPPAAVIQPRRARSDVSPSSNSCGATMKTI
jgi:hypothetical protein